MTGDGLVQEAVAELYSSDPDKFVARRDLLVTQARAAGEAAAAKKIAGLRKPTRSAWVVNQLARLAPEAVPRLAALGQQLREAQRTLNGPAIRELSVLRRQLIDELARQAFAVSGQRTPSAALRDEVTATLAAALADPQVTEQLQAGGLERVTRRTGFVPEKAPVLALVPPHAGRRRAPPARADALAGTSTPAGTLDRSAPAGAASGRAAPGRAGNVTPLAAARARAERERREAAARAAAEAQREHRRAVTAAQQALREAERARDAADRAERKLENMVGVLEDRLAGARQSLADARLEARRASSGHRQAQRTLDRLQN